MAADLPWHPTDEHSWLVLADWLDENGGDGQRVRNEVADPDGSNQWHYEYRGGVGGVGVGADGGGGGVGGGVGGDGGDGVVGVGGVVGGGVGGGGVGVVGGGG